MLALFTFSVFSQGTESFTNISSSSSSYSAISWTGDNGLTWSASDARTDQTMTGKCVVIRVGSITCNGIPNGIGTLSFKHQQFFSGSAPVLEVRINGTLIGSVTNTTTSAQTATFNNINVSGGFSLEIRQTTSSLRVGIDDISWTAYSGNPCVAPSAQPTSLAFSGNTNTTSNVSFSAAAGADKYLVVRSTSSSLSTLPVNGTSYAESDALGNGVVAYSGANTSFVSGDLLPGTTYYFFVFAYNDVNCSGGPTYNTAAPLTASTTTTTPPACAAPVNSISGLQLTASASSVNGSFTAASDADGYLVIQSTSATLGFTPANGTVYTIGQTTGSGTVIKNGTGTTFVASGLTATTTYYFYVFAENNFSCSGGPMYNSTAVSGSTTTTAVASGDWPTGYYDYANGKSCSSLKTALRYITDATSGSFTGDTYTHNAQSYDGLWDQYKITDIKPREVGTGSATVIWDIYSDKPNATDPYNFTPGTQQCGSYSGEGSCYNREHSFPKSWFNDASPMYSDYHHIFPTDGYVNGKRSNYKYGEVSSASWTSQNGSKLGTSAIAGIGGPVFEPIDEYKGDVARAYLYMVTRYENLLATWNGYATEGTETLDGTMFPAVEVPYLRLMIKWHNQDPPSQKEKDRNNGAYSFQGNRNPFVDHPEYVAAIWNSSCPGLSALPVDIMFFTGKLEGSKVLLNWEVGTEKNLSAYIVERSFNGTDYTAIASVAATNRSAYNYTDNIEQLAGRRIYYRLKKLDRDGSFSYSEVFSLHVPLNLKFTVYPNPAGAFISLHLNNNSNDQAAVTVTDMSGRVVYQNKMQASQGVINIPTNGLNSSTYVVKLLLGGAEYYQMVQVLK